MCSGQWNVGGTCGFLLSPHTTSISQIDSRVQEIKEFEGKLTEGEAVDMHTLESGCQAALSFAFCAFFLFAFMIVEPTKKPIPESPITRTNAGSRIAHSRAGK